MMVTELSGVQFGCNLEGNSLVVLWGKWGWFRIMKVSLEMSSGVPCSDGLSGISLLNPFIFKFSTTPRSNILNNFQHFSSPSPPPNPQNKFYLFKTFEKSKSSHIYVTTDYELMAPCKPTQHCWTINDGSCCVRLPVAYGTILSSFGRKRAEINETKAFDQNAPEISTIPRHEVQLPAFSGNFICFIAQIQDLVSAEILLIQRPDC